MVVRARVDRHKCVGAGNCISLAPTAFDWLAGDYGKADVVGPDSVDEDVLKAAAFACPTAAIILEDVAELLPWQLRGKTGPARRVMKTFMFTDIVGSTTLVEALGDEAWDAILRWHNTALREVFAAHSGEEISTTGDGFFVSFDSPDLAIAAAIAIQRRLAEHRSTQGFAPQIRIGLHASDATTDPTSADPTASTSRRGSRRSVAPATSWRASGPWARRIGRRAAGARR